jgi:hypothetical protein
MSRFSFKTFTSFLLVLTFLALTVSGIMLFLSPPGRIAHWTNWTLFGLGKEEWGAVHILMALVFLTGSLFHLLKFNWKVFLHYLKTKQRGFRYLRELAVSIGLFGLVLVGTLMQVPPFSSVIALHEEAKAYWEGESESPPIPHMELMTLREVASNLSLTQEQLSDGLTKLGLKSIDENQTLSEIAEAAQFSPHEVYGLLQKSLGDSHGVGSGALKPGRGMGRRTLAEISMEMEIAVDQAIEKLKANGIEANPDSRLRDLASEAGRSPHELLEILGE